MQPTSRAKAVEKPPAVSNPHRFATCWSDIASSSIKAHARCMRALAINAATDMPRLARKARSRCRGETPTISASPDTVGAAASKPLTASSIRLSCHGANPPCARLDAPSGPAPRMNSTAIIVISASAIASRAKPGRASSAASLCIIAATAGLRSASDGSALSIPWSRRSGEYISRRCVPPAFTHCIGAPAGLNSSRPIGRKVLWRRNWGKRACDPCGTGESDRLNTGISSQNASSSGSRQ